MKVGTNDICETNLQERISFIKPSSSMLIRDRFWWTLVGIGIVTIVSGILQCMMPALLLRVLSPDVTAASRYFLTITGIFTAICGALLVHALVNRQWQHVAVLWVGLQKIFTSAAVGIAIQEKIFSIVALVAAGFDLVSGVMIISYWFWVKQLQKEEAANLPR